jgi:hypothetical protein
LTLNLRPRFFWVEVFATPTKKKGGANIKLTFLNLLLIFKARFIIVR